MNASDTNAIVVSFILRCESSDPIYSRQEREREREREEWVGERKNWQMKNRNHASLQTSPVCLMF